MIDFESIGIGESIHLPGSVWESGPQKLDMLPALTSNNPMALLRTDTVESAKLSEGDASLRVSLANRIYVIREKFRHAMGFSFLPSKSMPGMKNVQAMSSPFKIANMVVGRIVVKMIDNISILSRAYKCNCNKSVNKRSSFPAIRAKLDDTMSVFTLRRGENFSSSYAKNITKIGYFVKGFKSLNWQKNFSHIQPLLVDGSVSVAWQLAQKPAFGSYPSQAGEF